MKIKLSKSQWEFMGRKAGWMKTALFPSPGIGSPNEGKDTGQVYESLSGKGSPNDSTATQIDPEINQFLSVIRTFINSDQYAAAIGALEAAIKHYDKFDIPPVHEMIKTVQDAKKIHDQKVLEYNKAVEEYHRLHPNSEPYGV
jgi:hypothetical protein